MFPSGRRKHRNPETPERQASFLRKTPVQIVVNSRTFSFCLDTSLILPVTQYFSCDTGYTLLIWHTLYEMGGH